MANELSIINAIKQVIQSSLNAYLPQSIEQIGEKNVVIDFPDTDQMPMKNMFYIVPNWANYNTLTTESDDATFNIAVFIVCRKDKPENLTVKVHLYFDALQNLIHSNMTLDGEVDFSIVEDVDFYYGVDGTRNVQAAEASVSIHYTKDYI